MIRHSFQIVIASRGESSRLIDGITSGTTPCAASKALMSSSPGGTMPVTRSVSTPSFAIASLSQTTCRAGPPTLSRAMIRRTRMSVGEVDAGRRGGTLAKVAVDLIEHGRLEAGGGDDVVEAGAHLAEADLVEAAVEVDLRALVDPQGARVDVDGVVPPLQQLAVGGVGQVPRHRQVPRRGDLVELAEVLARQDHRARAVAGGVGALRAL